MDVVEARDVSSDETRRLTSTSEPSALQASTLLRSGARIGRYLVLEELGRGGMGVVVRAYDPRLRREVALKAVRADALSSTAHARMLREAQAMAKLSHPNVVAVYDVDVIGREVVIAMEYVAGTTLGAWLERHASTGRGSWRAVLDMFVTAGRGVVAAHETGILHRDFKPANVLVGKDGRARVTDFGLARSLEAEARPRVRDDAVSAAAVSSTLTQVGDVLGTPRYMAPEQLAGEAVGPAADQYAFCVALYESLTGRDAFVPGDAGWEAVKCIRPPQWPRDVRVPARIVAAISRGLRPEADERWPSMGALLEHLSYDGKTRRLPWVMAASATAFVGASGVAWAGWQHERAQRCSGGVAQIEEVWNARTRAQVRQAMLDTGVAYAGDTSRRVTAVLDDYASAWAAGHREACEATAVRGEQTPALLDLRMACLHQAKVGMEAVARLLVGADEETVENAHRMIAGLPALERCGDTDALQAEVDPPAPADEAAVEAVRVRLAEVKVLSEAGKHHEAKPMALVLAAEAEAIGYGPLQADVALLAGRVLEYLGESEAAREAYQKALTVGLRSRQRVQASQAASYLVGLFGEKLGRASEGRAQLATALGLTQRGTLRDARLRRILGLLHEEESDFEAAERAYRSSIALYEELGAPELTVLEARASLAALFNELYRHEEAEREQRKILAANERELGPDHPDTLGYAMNLSNTLDHLRRHDEAEVLLRDALERARGALGPHRRVAGLLHNLGSNLHLQGRNAEAIGVLRETLELYERLSLRRHLASTHAVLGQALDAEGRQDEAEIEYRKALELQLEMYGVDHLWVVQARLDLGRGLFRLRRYDESLEQVEQALAVVERAGHRFGIPIVRVEVGRALAALGRLDEADDVLAVAEREFADVFGREDEGYAEVVELRAKIAADPRRRRK